MVAERWDEGVGVPCALEDGRREPRRTAWFVPGRAELHAVTIKAARRTHTVERAGVGASGDRPITMFGLRPPSLRSEATPPVDACREGM